MGLILVGKNGMTRALSYDQAASAEAVLTEILGKKVDLGKCTESEGKTRADALRKNVSRLRLLKSDHDEQGYELLVVQGVDPRRMLSERYHYRRFDLETTPEAVELDSEWEKFVLGLAEFLDECEGIVRVE